jgi:hypothetical protein
MAVQMASLGHVPVGALSLSAFNRATLLRKIGQWGGLEVVRYARTKLFPQSEDASARNPHLERWLQQGNKSFNSLREVGTFCGFPVARCSNQNSPDAISSLKAWSPDLIIFTGGNILRKPLLEVPRLGVLNVHLGLLPEIRGMSSPEWSLLTNIPVGVTVHYMDAGIDTGPILLRSEFADAIRCESLSEMRHRLIAFGVEKAGEVVEGLARGTISATPQSDVDNDSQFFVMHEWLQVRAAERLTASRAPIAGVVHG